MDITSSSPVRLWVNFEGSTGLQIPDTGTVTYSLFDGAGIPLAVDQVLVPAEGATGVSVPILAINNILDDENAFERRTVQVSWTAGGETNVARRAYRVILQPPYAAVPEDVRRYLSLNEDELRDDEVDLFAAWLALHTEVEGFDPALAAGNLRGLRAERAIVLTAAVALFPSLRYRIAQSTTDGNVKFERLRDARAFAQLVEGTQAELLAITRELTGDTSATLVAPVLLRLGTISIDPITGTQPATGG